MDITWICHTPGYISLLQHVSTYLAAKPSAIVAFQVAQADQTLVNSTGHTF